MTDPAIATCPAPTALLFCLVACAYDPFYTAPPVPQPDPPLPRPTLAVVEAIDRVPACMNSAIDHYVFRIDGAPGLASFGPVYPSSVSDPPGEPARFFVAELVWHEAHVPEPGSFECDCGVHCVPRHEATAARLVPARDRATAERMLVDYRRDGLPVDRGTVLIDVP